MRRLKLLMGVLAAVAACRAGPRTAQSSGAAGSAAATLAAGSAYVDSAIPVEEALRRFRTGLTQPAGLVGGHLSRETLVRGFVRALEVRDTAALRRMVLSPAEFAWLYYPSSPLSRPPYELAPSLLWFQLQGESERGASRLLAERGGQALGYRRHTCGPARQEGTIRLHPSCALYRTPTPGDSLVERLFGLIVEQGGRYKFVSYANRLD